MSNSGEFGLQRGNDLFLFGIIHANLCPRRLRWEIVFMVTRIL